MVKVLQLVRVVRQVVEFPLPRLVLDVERIPGPYRLVVWNLNAPTFIMPLLYQTSIAPGHLLAAQERCDGAPVHKRGNFCAAEVGQCWREIGIEDQFVTLYSLRDAGTTHHQGEAPGLRVGRPLPTEAVLAEVEAVIGVVEEVSVIQFSRALQQRDNLPYGVIYGLQATQPVAVAARKVVDLVSGEPRPLAYVRGLVGDVSLVEVRRAREGLVSKGVGVALLIEEWT